MAEVALVKITCCAEGYHVPFWISAAHNSHLHDTHEWFYCPNGHQQHYPQETDEEKFKRLYEFEKKNRVQVERRAERNYQNFEQQIRYTAAQKGLVTKLRKQLREKNERDNLPKRGNA